MAGAGFKTFNTGDVLTSSDVNTYLMQQTVMVFDDASARSTALPTPSEGMFSYLKDTNLSYRYDGSAWISDVGTTSPLTTKGDVWGYSTADARIPVGADGTVLTADSGETLGVKWAAPELPGLRLISASTFTSVASQSFNNVFSSTYASYFITYNIVGQDSSARAIYLRLRASSTDTTTNYVSGFGGWNIESTGQTLNEAITGSTFIQLGFSSNNTEINRLLGQAYIHSPDLAQWTMVQGNAISEKAAAYKGGYQTYGMQTGTTQFDGFTLYAASGNIAGTVRIYGMRNSL